MCGIAGIIHRGKTAEIGQQMIAMLQALKHRGPDSTGYAVYGHPNADDYIMRVKIDECHSGQSAGPSYRHEAELDRRAAEIARRLDEANVQVIEQERVRPHALRYRLAYDGDMAALSRAIEDVSGVEILSLGTALELVKDLGDAKTVGDAYRLGGFQGTHAIGHTRMATESDVDIRSAHPYWAFPYKDISLVHNGQLTNYWSIRREMERKGHRFASDCDSELLAVYTARNLAEGLSLEQSLRRSIDEIDGVFTYVVATRNQLGMAKDSMAAKPMVLYESDDLIVLASEEIAIRAILPHEIDTYDPYDEEVRVWQI